MKAARLLIASPSNKPTTLLHCPTLRTPRLLLRRFEQSDAAFVLAGLSHPEVIKYYGVQYHSMEAVQTQMNWYEQLLAEGTGVWWCVCTANGEMPIGACGFNGVQALHRKAETGYWLMPQHQGHGYMHEAMQAALQHAFDVLQLHRIEAVVETENRASMLLAERLGFRLEGTQRDVEWREGRFVSHHLYGLLANEWTPGPAQ